MKLFLATIFILAGASVGAAQVASGGNYTLNKSAVAAGGGLSFSPNVTYAVQGTIGQAIAQTNSSGMNSSGVTYALTGGFQTDSQLGTTAAEAMISGRVRTADDRGIKNVRVVVTMPTGETRLVLTNSFGYYRLSGLPAGEIYVVQVSSKRFAFANPVRVVSLNGNLDDYDFIADE